MCCFFHIFNKQNYILFKISALALFFSKIFVKFPKFQPRYSYKRKRVYLSFDNLVKSCIYHNGMKKQFYSFNNVSV